MKKLFFVLSLFLLTSGLNSCSNNNEKFNFDDSSIVLEPSVSRYISRSTFLNDGEGNLVGTIKELNENNKIKSIDVYISQDKLKIDNEYSYKINDVINDCNEYTLTINKVAFNGRKGNIIISPILESVVPEEKFIVTIDANEGTYEGEKFKTISNVSKNTYLSSLINDNPIRNTYTFDGWAIKGEIIDINKYKVTSNVTLVARWKLNIKTTYSFTFTSLDGFVTLLGETEYTDDNIVEGSLIRYALTAPTTLHTINLKVYLDGEEITSGFTFKNNVFSIIATGNVSIEATTIAPPEYEYCSIAFHDNYDNGTTKYAVVIKGNKVERPNDPLREDYQFEEWRLEDRKTSFNFNEPIMNDLNLYAKWVGEEEFDHRIKGVNKTKIYDGLDSKGSVIQNSYLIPEDATVNFSVYEGQVQVTDAKEVGKYYISATISKLGYRTKILSDKVLTINKRPIDEEKYWINPTSLEKNYDGENKSLSMNDVCFQTGLEKPTKVTYLYNNDPDIVPINQGSYDFVATLEFKNYENLIIEDTLIIDRGKFTDDVFKEASYVYDGKIKTFEVDKSKLHADTTVLYKYGDESEFIPDVREFTERGKYTITCKLINPNYELKEITRNFYITYKMTFINKTGEGTLLDNLVIPLDGNSRFYIVLRFNVLFSELKFKYYGSVAGFILLPEKVRLTFDPVLEPYFEIEYRWDYNLIKGDIIGSFESN